MFFQMRRFPNSPQEKTDRQRDQQENEKGQLQPVDQAVKNDQNDEAPPL